MISALEGWSFTGPKGQQTIRASDHAMLQPMFQVKLTQKNGKCDSVPTEVAPREVHGAPGEEVAARRPGQEGIVSTEAPILATRDLGLDIGGARIVADVSLEVREGEFVGIIGPNGAGKTTLFNLLSGLDPADGRARRARRAGRHPRSAAPADAGRARPHVPGLERLPAALRAARTCGSRRRRSSAAR